MKILFLIDYLPSPDRPGGGLQNYVSRIAQGLFDLGEDVTVICSEEADYSFYQFPVNIIATQNWQRKLLRQLRKFTFHKIDNTLDLLLRAFLFQLECKKIPETDVIQSPNYKCMGVKVSHTKAKLVVRASSYRPLWSEDLKYSIDTRLLILLEKKLFIRADRVIAPSNHMAGILLGELGISANFLPTPIPDTLFLEDFSWFRDNMDGKKYILYFGTMLKRKGLYVLAEAMKKVWARDPGVLLVLAGPDMVVNGQSNLERMKRIIAPHENKVIFASNLNQEKLLPLIRNAWFTVLPSLQDNCPNSMLEAMALGKVVLGTYESGMEEFYPELCKQLLVPNGDINALAEKIIWLWYLPKDEVNGLGLQGKLFIETNHNRTKCANELRDFYLDVLAQS